MVTLAVTYIIGLVTMNEKIRFITVDTFMITILNLLLSFVIGAFWYVPSSFVNNKVNLLIPHTIDALFPSDHAIVFVTSFLYDRFLKNIVQATYFKVEGSLLKRLPVLKQF